jgi:phage terminase small subunit
MRARPLTVREKAFAEAYALNGGNGTQAARTAGYSGTDKVLGITAVQVLERPSVREYLLTLHTEAENAAARRLAAGKPEPGVKSRLRSIKEKLFEAIAEAGGAKVEHEWVEEKEEGKRVKVKRVVDGAAAARTLLELHEKRQDRKSGQSQPPPQVNILIQQATAEELRTLRAIASKPLPAGK